MRGLSLVAASGGHSSSRCAGLSLSWPLLFRSTGSRRAGSVIVAHGPSCSVARGILPDQGSNPCPPHWQADSQPLRHQGSPYMFLYENTWYRIYIKNHFNHSKKAQLLNTCYISVTVISTGNAIMNATCSPRIYDKMIKWNSFNHGFS